MASILVADDSPTNRQYLLVVLESAGHRCLEAVDGGAALEVILNERPDLAILDIEMPIMDGFELVRRIRSIQPIAQTPVMFYTATRLALEARKLAAAWDVFDVLEKPTEPEWLLRRVQAALALQMTGTTNARADRVEVSTCGA